MSAINVRFSILNNMQWSFAPAPHDAEPGLQPDRTLVYRVINVPPGIDPAVIVDLVATVPTRHFINTHAELRSYRGQLLDVAA